MKRFFVIFLIILPFVGFSQVNDDFDDDNLTSSPAWTGELSKFQIMAPTTSSDGSINSTANADAHVLMSKPNTGDAVITTASTVAYGEWVFSVADGKGWVVSSANDYIIILMSDDNTVANLKQGALNFNGYYLRFDGSNQDKFVLYKQTGNSSTIVLNTSYPASTDGSTPIGRTVKITRSTIGEWTIFIDEGFDATPTTQRGTKVTDNTHTSSSYFGISTNIGSPSVSRVLYFDNLKIQGLNTNDKTSVVADGADAEPATISSLENTADGVQVFDFKLQDISGDGLSTIITSLDITQGDNNDVTDWTSAIAGAKLFGTDLSTPITATITSNTLNFSVSEMIKVDEGTIENYNIKIWLKTDLSNIEDNNNLEFKLDYTDIACANSGSEFGNGSIESGDDKNAISIEATKLLFTNTPAMVAQNTNFSVTVNATDVNGNTDIDNTANVTISLNSGTGNLSVSENLIAGTYTWSNLIHSDLEDFSLKAEASGLTSASSNTVTCAESIFYLKDDFEDANLDGWQQSTAGHWEASNLAPITGQFSLHQIYEASAYDSDQISYSLGNISLSEALIWKFQVKYPNNPSDKNRWYVFLTADADNKEMKAGGAINGYAIGVNFKEKKDTLRLWKIENGVGTTLIKTNFVWSSENYNTPSSIFVSRSAIGEWEVKTDADGGFNNLISQGTATDATFTTTKYFGVGYDYSSTKDQILWLDDIYFGPPIPDTEAPTLTKVDIVSNNSLKLTFSENLLPSQAQLLANYSVDNGIGAPSTATLDVTNPNIVNLKFDKTFVFEQSYTLHVENIEDLNNNTINPTDFLFSYYTVRPHDVVVTEIMADVSPTPVALPAYKYIEIYNTSKFDINLTGWTFKIGARKEVNFPDVNLKAHEYAILCTQAAQSSFAGFGKIIPIIASEIDISSTTAKKITIKNVSSKIIEQIIYDPKKWYDDQEKDGGGWSMERIDPTNFCSQSNNWHASLNYTGGTPGIINSVNATNPDNISPTIENIKIISARDIIVDFSEIVDTTTALLQTSYVLTSATPPIIPLLLELDNSDPSKIHLKFNANLNFGENTLKIRNVSDYCGNTLLDSITTFNYKLIHPTNAEPKTSNQLIIYFSEQPLETTAQNIGNYLINSDIGSPKTAIADSKDPKIIHLTFDKEFPEDEKLTVSISGISDKYNNAMTDTSVNFVYHIIKPFEIVINELMIDVNPEPAGLPPVKYVELFNTSNYDIWLSDCIFTCASDKFYKFPATIIPSKTYALLCDKKDEKLLKNFGTTIPILSSSDLSQTGKELLLFDSHLKMIYHLKYSAQWYNNETKKAGGWSLEKIDSYNKCEASTNWRASEDVSGGTPGRENSVHADNPDTKQPKVKTVSVKSSNKLIITFSKPVSAETALDTNNYNVDNFGNPKEVMFSEGKYTIVELSFDNQFVNEQENAITISNVTDNCSNIMETVTEKFTYYLIHPEYVWVLSNNQIKVKFSEEVDILTSAIKDSYIVDNQIGTPNYIVRGYNDPAEVYLQFLSTFEEGEKYNLSISAIKDINGNEMDEATLEFIYYNARLNDVVINEVLFNPKTGGVDFIELYNRSPYSINLLNLNIAKRNEEGQIDSKYDISNYHNLFAPGTYLVVTSDTLNIQKNYSTGGTFVQIKTMPSYPDDKGTVVIYDDRDSIIDQFTYNKDMQYPLISNENGVSLERIDFNMPTQDIKNWHSAAKTVGYATPGLKNSQYKNMSQAISEGEVTIDPEIFSPDEDGYNDILYINYDIPEGGNADVFIFDKNGRKIRTIEKNNLLATKGYWTWDGLNDDKTKAKIGIYAVVVKVFSLEGKVKIYRKSVVLSAKRK